MIPCRSLPSSVKVSRPGLVLGLRPFGNILKVEIIVFEVEINNLTLL